MKGLSRMKMKSIVKLAKDADWTAVIAFALAIAVLGLAVIWVPQAFIGFIVGAAFGMSKGKLEDALADDKDDGPAPKA